MSTLKAARGAQYPLVAEFAFSFDDTMVNTDGTAKDFGKTALAIAVDVINLPPGAVVIGGEIVTETAFDTASYSVKIGDSADDDRYLAATDVKAAGRVALVPAGFRNVDGLNVRMTITNADVCTAGKGTLRVQYITSGKTNEIQPI